MRIESECSQEIVVSYMREEIYVTGNNVISYMDIKIIKRIEVFGGIT